jgi:uncharacterized protein YdhG (YjbR/CyaY superfamily)
MAQKFTSIEDYIGTFPANVQTILTAVRRTIRSAVPAAAETISYHLPTFTLNGHLLVHIAAWKHYLSLYPVPAVDEALEQEIAPYRAAKSTLRFPYDRPIPYELIGRLVALRATDAPREQGMDKRGQ